MPTLYGADTQTVALLETVFHDVHAGGVRQISESLHLARRGLVALIAPRPLPLVDLTDDALKHLGVERRELVATAPSHYACTREWAAALHARRIGRIEPVGLVWRSRVAELAEEDALVLRDLLPRGSDVFMLFGDRLPTEPDAWSPGEPHFGDLASGEGRILAEEIATHLNAVIVSN